jgi:hypothetical protein
MVAETYRTGRPGRLMRAGQVLAATGVAGGVLLAGRSRVAARASGLALLGASVLTRFGVFEAGLRSAADPRYTVIPQRQRMEGAAAGPAPSH